VIQGQIRGEKINSSHYCESLDSKKILTTGNYNTEITDLRTQWLNVKWNTTLNRGMANGVSTLYIIITPTTATATVVTVQMKCDGTW
jgi:hypothetical protein